MDNGRGPDLQDRNLGAKIDSCAAQLRSRQARDFYLAGRRPRAGGRQSVSESPDEVRPRAAFTNIASPTREHTCRPGNGGGVGWKDSISRGSAWPTSREACRPKLRRSREPAKNVSGVSEPCSTGTRPGDAESELCLEMSQSHEGRVPRRS